MNSPRFCCRESHTTTVYFDLSAKFMALVLRNQNRHMTVYQPNLRNAVAISIAKHLYNNRAALLEYGSQALTRIHSLFSGGNSKGKSGKKGGRRSGGRIMSNTDRMSMTTMGNPIALSTQINNPTYWSQESLPQKEGIGPGIRITGRQFFSTAATGAANDYIFGGGYKLQLSPDAFGGRVALIGRTYDKFAFRHVRLYYCPICATTQAGSFTMAYYADPAFESFSTPVYSTLMQVDPCVVTPLREKAVLEMNYTGDDLFFSEIDSTSIASLRQSEQGQFIGMADAAYPSIVGIFLVEYVLDLYQPITDLGYTLMRLTKEEKAACDAVLVDLRSPERDDFSHVSANTTRTPDGYRKR